MGCLCASFDWAMVPFEIVVHTLTHVIVPLKAHSCCPFEEAFIGPFGGHMIIEKQDGFVMGLACVQAHASCAMALEGGDKEGFQFPRFKFSFEMFESSS